MAAGEAVANKSAIKIRFVMMPPPSSGSFSPDRSSGSGAKQEESFNRRRRIEQDNPEQDLPVFPEILPGDFLLKCQNFSVSFFVLCAEADSMQLSNILSACKPSDCVSTQTFDLTRWLAAKAQRRRLGIYILSFFKRLNLLITSIIFGRKVAFVSRGDDRVGLPQISSSKLIAAASEPVLLRWRFFILVAPPRDRLWGLE